MSLSDSERVVTKQDLKDFYDKIYPYLGKNTSNYSDLTNKPSINSVPIDGNVTTTDLKIDYNNLTNKPDIPNTTSDLTNDSGFVTSSEVPGLVEVPTKVSDLTNDIGFITDGDIPSKTSDLTNDAGFITIIDLPTATSDLTNDSGFITASDIPEVNVPTKISDLTDDSDFVESSELSTVATTGAYSDLTGTPSIPATTSDLTNDSGFITNAVNDLANYYLKSEAYTKAEVDAIVTNIKNSRFEVVSELPTEDIKTNVIYLVPSNDPESNNIKDEYINLDGTSNSWEKIGSTDIDLSDYVTSTVLNTALDDYTTTTDLNALLTNYVTSTNLGTTLEDYVESTDLSTVATSGSYNDLTDKPSIPSNISDLTNDSGFITSNDIPSIPTKISDLTNDSNFVESSDLATVATSGSYNDLSNTPSIPANLADLSNVEIANPSDGDVLIYNATSGKWVNGMVSPTLKTATLVAGQPTVTFTNMPTTGNNLIDFFTSTGINYVGIVESGSTVTLTYEPQSADVLVFCKIESV